LSRPLVVGAVHTALRSSASVVKMSGDDSTRDGAGPGPSHPWRPDMSARLNSDHSGFRFTETYGVRLLEIS
jgi:hypothetical protein